MKCLQKVVRIQEILVVVSPYLKMKNVCYTIYIACEKNETKKSRHFEVQISSLRELN